MTLAERSAALQAGYAHIAETRMAGLGLLHPGLAVAAVGFEVLGDEPAMAMGVLVTPWFMNLVRLPTGDGDGEATLAAPCQRAVRAVGGAQIEFLGAHEAGIGRFEACSLFSPMAEFVDQAAAVATAQAVLVALRRPVPVPDRPSAPARRGFLLGRHPGVAAP